jgi:hypothetical protein
VKRDKGLRFRDYEVKLAGSNNGATFEGYGSVFGVVDSYKEIVAPGAFTNSIAEIKSSGRALPVLWNHNSSEPIGKYSDLSEDAHGLRVKGELMVDAVARAKEVAALVDAGIISGLSIGYWVKDESYDQETGIWTLKELKLREISIVTFPANDDARIETIKAKLAGGGQLSIRECEKILRDAGFSKAEAIRMLRAGHSGYVGEGDPAQEKAVTEALQELRAAFQIK